MSNFNRIIAIKMDYKNKIVYINGKFDKISKLAYNTSTNREEY